MYRVETFGEVIRKRRRELELTADEVARRLSTSRAAVSLWEHGKTAPRPRRIGQIAEVLGLDAERLLKLYLASQSQRKEQEAER